MLELVDKKDVENHIICHHRKYKEVHGVNETVQITVSEHSKIHAKLRREYKCKIPSEKLRRISQKAHKFTEKYKTGNPSGWIRNQVIKDIELKKK